MYNLLADKIANEVVDSVDGIQEVYIKILLEIIRIYKRRCYLCNRRRDEGTQYFEKIFTLGQERGNCCEFGGFH